MNRISVFVLLPLLAVVATPALARKWASRDGKFSVEAELIDADSEQAVLKRSDNGKVIKVPLKQLSQSDNDYVQEAMKAAAGTPTEKDPFAAPEAEVPAPVAKGPAGKVAAKTTAIQPAQEKAKEPARETVNATTGSTAGGPRLAVKDQFGWQVEPDPDPAAIDYAALPQIELPFPADASHDDIVFGGARSPFVALGESSSNCIRELWDLRTQKRVGAIREVMESMSQITVSPDGKWLGCWRSSGKGKIHLWSFKSGKLEREINLGDSSGTLWGLDFAGPNRIVASCSNQQAIVTWDIETGDVISKISIRSPPQREEYTISPGGNYLAMPKEREKIEIFDLRNGALAGDAYLSGLRGSDYFDLRAIQFSPDGSELAVLSKGLKATSLLCWSMIDGQLIAQHALSELRDALAPSAYETRGEAVIDWLPEGKGWLLFGVAVVDRNKGGPIWIERDKRNQIHPRPCRLLDANRRLMVNDERPYLLQSKELPWKTIDESAQLVRSGGSVADVGLPSIAIADRSGSKKLELSYEPLKYTVNARAERLANPVPAKLPLGRSQSLVHKILTPAASANLILVNGEADSSHPKHEDSDFQRSHPISEAIDVKSGKPIYRFEAPPRLELKDISPGGKLGLFIENTQKNRVDVFDMAANKHIVGFCPFLEEKNERHRNVTWARFADDEHLLTYNSEETLTLWQIDGCRALYDLYFKSGSLFLNRGRKYFAAGMRTTISLVEPLSGRSCGELKCPGKDGDWFPWYTAFREDDLRLAVVFRKDEESRLVVWEPTSGKLLCDFALPFTAAGVRWTDPDHVVIHNSRVGDKNERGYNRETLINVVEPRVAWHYYLDHHTLQADGPDDRYWYRMLAVDSILQAVSLPDAEAKKHLATIPAPQPVFGKGKAVTLKMDLGAMPDSLEDRRQREDALNAELEKHFTAVLNGLGMRVEPNADAILKVSIKNLTNEEILYIRTQYSSLLYAKVRLSTTTVWCKVSLQTKDGIVLWKDEHFVESEDVRLQDKLKKNASIATAIHYAQWQNAKQWCIEAVLPTTTYHPKALTGAGESMIDRNGPYFMKRYE